MLVFGPFYRQVCDATCGHGDNQSQAAPDGRVWVHSPDAAGVVVDVCCPYYHKGPCKLCVEPCVEVDEPCRASAPSLRTCSCSLLFPLLIRELSPFYLSSLGKAGPTPHHGHGRAGFAHHLRGVVPVAWFASS